MQWGVKATGIQGIENWFNAHPVLLSLWKNRGNIVSGTIWISKFTPAGMVTGLVNHYGYEELLELMGGNIEISKEKLTAYFTEYDEDITPEQASYLANCSMKVMETAEQIAVHQVAAKGFNKVRRRGWEWLNDVVGFGELSELLNIQMNGVAQV